MYEEVCQFERSENEHAFLDYFSVSHLAALYISDRGVYAEVLKGSR